MAGFTSSPVAMLAFSIITGALGQILLKWGMRIVSSGGGREEVGAAAVVAAIRAIGNPWVLAGFLLYGLSSIVWLMILKKVPLSTAYPMISAGYIVVVLLSALVLREQVRWGITVPGLFLISVGVTLIGLGLSGGR